MPIRTAVLFAPALLLLASASSSAIEIVLPKVPGWEIEMGKTIVIEGVDNTLGFRFSDGRLVVSGDGRSAWSHNGGLTWSMGPRGPDDKTVFDLGDGEILSCSMTSVKRADGRYDLFQRRSLDGWKTVQGETAILDSPQAAPAGGDAGDRHDGLLMHHGILSLKNGDLLATMYGNFQGDTQLADGYPEEFQLRKYRTVVVTSSDRGKTWRNPVTVAYNKMLGRGLDPDSGAKSTAIVPAVTQEGFCEADLTRAPNGDILCAMRSGGRISKFAPIFPTPLYLSSSSDEGRTWSPAVQMADRGVCPQLVTLENGIIVCAFARPESWLIFSDDNGLTWKGLFRFSGSDSYSSVLPVASDRVLVVHHGNDAAGEPAVVGTFLRGRR